MTTMVFAVNLPGAPLQKISTRFPFASNERDAGLIYGIAYDGQRRRARPRQHDGKFNGSVRFIFVKPSRMPRRAPAKICTSVDV